MKKVFTALFITILFISTAFTASTVNITNSVETIPLTLSIVYNNDSNLILNDGNTNIELTYTASALNDVALKTTENFYIKGTGNIPKNQNITLEITGDQFLRTTDNGTITESGIYPSVLYTSKDDNNNSQLAHGASIHSYLIDDILAPTNYVLENTALGSFKLQWGGDKSLIAGKYISAVTFNISAE
jgi:hypothetical protein